MGRRKERDSLETATVEAHKNAVEELYTLDPETQAHQLRISNFLLKYPELAGISYASADLLIAEKNIKVQKAVIKRVAAEILRRADVDAVGFRFTYRKVTENQVRRILHAERLKENPNAKTQKPQNAEITLECPFCKRETTYKRVTRNNVVSFRATEAIDDAITHLAKECNISRSRLLSELLFIERRFGSMRV